MNDVRALIPTAHGHIADYLAANKQDTTILMTGGDTLMGVYEADRLYPDYTGM